MSRGVQTALFLLGLAALEASTILDPADAPVTDADYQALGNLFPAVGEVHGNGFLDGTGVLISDRWVVTAGHIAFYASSATFTVGGVSYVSSNIHMEPGYVFSFSAVPHDLALIELQTPVAGVDPVPIYGFDTPADLLGLEATWVGFGLGGTGLTGQNPGGGIKRGFTNVIDSIGGFGLPASAFVSDFDRPGGTDNSGPGSDPQPTALEGNLTPGDSGGGVFVEIGGVPYLIGINSFQAALDPDVTLDGDYGDLSGATHLSFYEEWIESVSDVGSVPEPGVLIFLALAGAGAIALRRHCRGRVGLGGIARAGE